MAIGTTLTPFLGMATTMADKNDSLQGGRSVYSRTVAPSVDYVKIRPNAREFEREKASQ